MDLYFSEGFYTPLTQVVEQTNQLHPRNKTLAWADKLFVKILHSLLETLESAFLEFQIEGEIEADRMRQEYELGLGLFRLLEKGFHNLEDSLPNENQQVSAMLDQFDNTLAAYAEVLETFEILSKPELVANLKAVKSGDYSNFISSKELFDGLESRK